ncbi:MAG: cell surface protein SprA, partial [bacterium]|nr:cell surface protein SprA [bacterium]
TFSGQNKGLFGLKGIAKVGPLKLTTIASLEKGKKNKLKANSGEQEREVRIQDIDFVKDQIFVIDTVCLDRARRVGSGGVSSGLGFIITDNIVYVTPVTGMTSTDVPIRGFAMAEPPPVALFDSAQFAVDNVDNFSNNFIPLPKSEYRLDENTGILTLNRQLSAGQTMGIVYCTSLGDTIGSFTPISGVGNSKYLLLKLLRGSQNQASSKTWNLMLRNYYSLQGQNISKESFEATIYKSNTEPPQQTQNGQFYTNVLGIDRIDNSNSSLVSTGDGKIDAEYVDFSNGFIRFPALHPFAPRNILPTDTFRWPDWFFDGALQESVLDTSTYLRAIYNNLNPGVGSQYYIHAKVRSRTNVLNLGVAVLENSEEVTSDGRVLNRGSDYTIDYFSGTLTVLDQSALAAGRNLEVTYESGEIFQLDRKTLLGIRAEYALWEDSFIGFTFLSLNEKPLDKRVRLGNEPLSNRIWDINTRLQFKPAFMTWAMDALPLVATEEPSKITIEGEIAQVFPNPNTMSNDATGDKNGVAYVDDFESAKRTTPLPITWRSWSLSAYPLPDALRVPGDTLAVFPARVFRWYNPYYQEPIKNIWPDRDVNSNVANTTQTLVIDYDPKTSRTGAEDTVASRKNSWGAITRFLGSGYSNQQEAKYVEIWLKNDFNAKGSLFLDFGRISENTIPDADVNPNTEDARIGERLGDGILQSDEDTGIDGIAGVDPSDWWDINHNRTGSSPVNTPDTATVLIDGQFRHVIEPRSFDDYYYNSSEYNTYDRINGTENNRTDEGGRYPNTEDLDGNGNSDKQNDFYRVTIELGDLNSPYIAGGSRDPNDPDNKGWYLYRIPIADTIRVNSPDLQNIQYFRIGLANFTSEVKLRIAEVNIVGNEWREPGPLSQQRTTQYALEADVYNTDENSTGDVSGYIPPPGVAGTIDPVSDVRQKEQSLRIKINQLGTGETSYLVKTLYDPINLLDYRRLKLFVHGGAFPTKVPSG